MVCGLWMLAGGMQYECEEPGRDEEGGEPGSWWMILTASIPMIFFNNVQMYIVSSQNV